ncbi:suppressor of fused domain protein [Kitasatospora sp. NPDC008115]|uniref:suppressor of fused domain protein n=1 Tax=Kitasatospora sp. NPDC008115 TaxID=3364022 RepID=UPI0036EC5BCC
MSAARTAAVAAVESHVRAFFEGHPVEAVEHDPRVLVVGPGPRGGGWTYVTTGCRSATAGQGQDVEFVITAHVRDRRFVELLAVIARHHRGGHRLGPEHSLPLGEPWVPGSACDHLLISLPYLYGPGLEHCPLPEGHARLLWALPVTAAEIGYRRRHGHDALERLFDEAAIVPTDPFRASVV